MEHDQRVMRMRMSFDGVDSRSTKNAVVPKGNGTHGGEVNTSTPSSSGTSSYYSVDKAGHEDT
ncbi:MAG: hypothetical protein ACRETL_09925, partial [Gammaproteobacteria bacterium]